MRHAAAQQEPKPMLEKAAAEAFRISPAAAICVAAAPPLGFFRTTGND